MYINRKDALEILGKLSREPYYQHDGEDYYVGIADATGEIYSMPSANIESTITDMIEEYECKERKFANDVGAIDALKELLKRIKR